MNTDAYPNIYDFLKCRNVAICGDIHGDFNLLVNKVCIQYQMKDTLIIVAGDCGFGFDKRGYYDNMVKRNSKRMNDANNWIVFIRGNHDNPAYFDGKAFCHKRFIAIPDYSVVKANGHTILCVGGAISIDRQSRKESWEYGKSKMHRYDDRTIADNSFTTNNYWQDEAPVFNEKVLSKITSLYKIDTVVTHTAPTFCELQDKKELQLWALRDDCLLADVQNERETMDAIYEAIKTDCNTITHWFYGHFHQSWHSTINGVLFKMLDIMELIELTP